jgi:hypothetical protein
MDCFSVKMTNGTVTGDARSRSYRLATLRTFDRFNDLLMTLPARFLRHCAAVRPHLDVVFKPARGEIEGMPEAVPCFGAVFSQKRGRCVAIVANGGGPVRRLQPTIILFLHDVTVCTGRSIVGEIGPTLGVGECVRTHTGRNTDRKPDDNPSIAGQFLCSLCALVKRRHRTRTAESAPDRRDWHRDADRSADKHWRRRGLREQDLYRRIVLDA